MNFYKAKYFSKNKEGKKQTKSDMLKSWYRSSQACYTDDITLQKKYKEKRKTQQRSICGFNSSNVFYRESKRKACYAM